MIVARRGRLRISFSLMVATVSPDSDSLIDLVPPLPPDEAETVPVGEPADMESVVQGIRQQVRARHARAEKGEVPPSPSGQTAVRDAHPKILGCCKGTLTVPGDLPPQLAHGIFQPGARYPVWVRFSNGSDEIQSDRAKDGRGIAIKVCGLPTSLGERLPTFAGDEVATQDFAFIDHPVFFVRDTRGYVAFVADKTAGRPGWRFFLPWPLRLRELWNALKVKKTPDNVLGQRFFSMAPFRLGPHVVKLSARPLTAAMQAPPGDEATLLRRALAAQLAAGPARFAIEVQRRAPGMPVEDATIEWRERKAPFETVAELHLPAQPTDSPERLRFGDRLSFSPWHGLLAHRPLGSLNRLRRVVYATIAAERRRLNGDRPPFEPTGDEP
jgi:hypothetical protein